MNTQVLLISLGKKMDMELKLDITVFGQKYISVLLRMTVGMDQEPRLLLKKTFRYFTMKAILIIYLMDMERITGTINRNMKAPSLRGFNILVKESLALTPGQKTANNQGITTQDLFIAVPSMVRVYTSLQQSKKLQKSNTKRMKK